MVGCDDYIVTQRRMCYGVKLCCCRI